MSRLGGLSVYGGGSRAATSNAVAAFDSGYGDYSSGYGGKEDCCPLVIDAICLFVILAAIAAAALFLERVINIEIMMGKSRRKRRSSSYTDYIGYIVARGN